MECSWPCVASCAATRDRSGRTPGRSRGRHIGRSPWDSLRFAEMASALATADSGLAYNESRSASKKKTRKTLIRELHTVKLMALQVFGTRVDLIAALIVAAELARRASPAGAFVSARRRRRGRRRHRRIGALLHGGGCRREIDSSVPGSSYGAILRARLLLCDGICRRMQVLAQSIEDPWIRRHSGRGVIATEQTPVFSLSFSILGSE